MLIPSSLEPEVDSITAALRKVDEDVTAQNDNKDNKQTVFRFDRQHSLNRKL